MKNKLGKLKFSNLWVYLLYLSLFFLLVGYPIISFSCSIFSLIMLLREIYLGSCFIERKEGRIYNFNPGNPWKTNLSLKGIEETKEERVYTLQDNQENSFCVTVAKEKAEKKNLSKIPFTKIGNPFKIKLMPGRTFNFNEENYSSFETPLRSLVLVRPSLKYTPI